MSRSAPAATRTTGCGMSRVLLVDDDQDILTLTSIRLTRAGYEVTTCADGEAGLAAIRRDRPHVALLDWMMPGLDGLQVAEAVRADPEIAGTRLALMTARPDAERTGFADEHGLDRVMIKPVSRQDLLAAVAALCAEC
jgi:DNA-binding response OmpR family regulator